MHPGKIAAVAGVCIASAALLSVGGYFLYNHLTTEGDNPGQNKPHFIVVLADDMGYNDIGYNNPEVLTPYLDSLAQEGIILENNYVQPMCTPSRSSLMTGRYPFTSGMQHGLIATGRAHCSPTNIRFLPEILREEGYQTHMAGKWHLGHCKWECTPTYRGFDTFSGMYNGWADHYTHIRDGAYDWRNNTDIDFTASGGMISALDDAVGQVVDRLKVKGMWNNTVLIFSSDNGGTSRASEQSSNLPLRSAKETLFEGGTKVPGFVSGSSVLKKGSKTKSLMHISDWAPTVLGMAGINHEEEMDGVNHSDMITKGTESNRKEVIHNIDIQWSGQFFYGNVAIRQGDMKMIWGLPGTKDGWGKNVTGLQRDDYYLGLINKSRDDYAEPPTGPKMSPQEMEFFFDIARAMGVYNITEEEMLNGKGHVLLFNLKDDPEERNNLANIGSSTDKIQEMKTNVMELIEKSYVPTSSNLMIDRTNLARPGDIWEVGWCDDINTDILAYMNN